MRIKRFCRSNRYRVPRTNGIAVDYRSVRVNRADEYWNIGGNSSISQSRSDRSFVDRSDYPLPRNCAVNAHDHARNEISRVGSVSSNCNNGFRCRTAGVSPQRALNHSDYGMMYSLEMSSVGLA